MEKWYFTILLNFNTVVFDECKYETFWIICVIYVFVMLSRLFIAALWSPEGKGLTSWFLFVMFIVILLLSHLVS